MSSVFFSVFGFSFSISFPKLMRSAPVGYNKKKKSFEQIYSSIIWNQLIYILKYLFSRLCISKQNKTKTLQRFILITLRWNFRFISQLQVCGFFFASLLWYFLTPKKNVFICQNMETTQKSRVVKKKEK